jgi:hypothetical protein
MHARAGLWGQSGRGTLAWVQVSVIENHIRQIGLAPTKAKNISNMSKVGAQLLLTPLR